MHGVLAESGSDGAPKDCDDACQALIEEAARRWRKEEGDYRDDVRKNAPKHVPQKMAPFVFFCLTYAFCLFSCLRSRRSSSSFQYHPQKCRRPRLCPRHKRANRPSNQRAIRSAS